VQQLISNLMKRKTLVALLLALTVFGAVYGFAATMNVVGNPLSAGNATVSSCETSTATGSYTVAYDTTAGTYKISGVSVTGIDAACAGKTLSATLTNNSGTTNLATLTATVPAGGGSVSLGAPASTVTADAVSRVAVAING